MASEKKVMDWELGLPSPDEIIPLSQCLIPPEMAIAFNIMREPSKSMADVHKASVDTLASLKSLEEFLDDVDDDGPRKKKCDQLGVDGDQDGSDKNKLPTVKKRRLVWTGQLHKRFIDVVDYLGIKKAVPKSIMQLMNVEGLTRENVASHLQKYRLYLKRKEWMNEPSPSLDHLFAFNQATGHLPLIAPKPVRHVPLMTAPVIAAQPLSMSLPVPESSGKYKGKGKGKGKEKLVLPSIPESSEEYKGKEKDKEKLVSSSLSESSGKYKGKGKLVLQNQAECSRKSKGKGKKNIMPPPPPQMMPPPPQMMSMMGYGHGHGHTGMPSVILGPNYKHFESHHQYSVISNKEWSLEKFTTSHHHVASQEK